MSRRWFHPHSWSAAIQHRAGTVAFFTVFGIGLVLAVVVPLALFHHNSRDQQHLTRSSPPRQTDSAAPSSDNSTPREPELPEAARHNTTDGAKAFVHYFFDVLNYADAASDPDVLSMLYNPSTCGICNYIKKTIENGRDRGEYAYRGKYSVKGVQVSPNGEENPGMYTDYSGVLVFDREEAGLVDSNNNPTGDIEPAQKDVRVNVVIRWEGRFKIDVFTVD